MSDFGDIADMIDEIGSGLVVQRATVVEGGYTGDTVTWATHLTLTGSVQNLSGTEIIQAEKLGIQASHRLYLNEKPDITEKDRILYNSKYYQITFVDNVANIDAHLKIFLNQSGNYGSQSN